MTNTEINLQKHKGKRVMQQFYSYFNLLVFYLQVHMSVADLLFHQNSLLHLLAVFLGEYNLYIRDISHFASCLGLFVQSD